MRVEDREVGNNETRGKVNFILKITFHFHSPCFVWITLLTAKLRPDKKLTNWDPWHPHNKNATDSADKSVITDNPSLLILRYFILTFFFKYSVQKLVCAFAFKVGWKVTTLQASVIIQNVLWKYLLVWQLHEVASDIFEMTLLSALLTVSYKLSDPGRQMDV